MNTQRKHEILNELDTIRKRVELLESHYTVGMISEEQHNETGIQLQNRVRELEEECGINDPVITSKGVLYNDQAEIFDETFNDKVHKAIDEIKYGTNN